MPPIRPRRLRIGLLHWLMLACVLDFGFAQLFKYAQRRGYYAPVVVCINYLAVAAGIGVYLGLTGRFLLTGDAVRVGVITGCAFICSMSIMTRSLRLANVGTVLMTFRMAIVVPVIVGMVVWGESVRPVQVLGILLAVPALVMMTRGSIGAHGGTGAWSLGIVVLVFCAQGTSNTCLRWVHYAGLDGQMGTVLLVVGTTAGGVGMLLLAMQRHRPRGVEVLTGAGIGLYNLIALVVILTALSRLPGMIVFPALGCTVVVLDGLSAHFFWKEPLRRLAWWGLALAVLAVLLATSSPATIQAPPPLP